MACYIEELGAFLWEVSYDNRHYNMFWEGPGVVCAVSSVNAIISNWEELKRKEI